jgi:hypothetical protein
MALVDIPGLEPPTWQQVADREYEPWGRKHLVIDTAAASASSAVDIILQEVNALAG